MFFPGRIRQVRMFSDFDFNIMQENWFFGFSVASSNVGLRLINLLLLFQVCRRCAETFGRTQTF